MPEVEHQRVRTTVTLDDDVAAKLREEVARTGSSFKEALNRAIRSGLDRPIRSTKVKPFRVKARRIGVRAGYENVWAFMEQLDELEKT